MQTKEKGYTFIEMTVVLVLLGVIGVTATVGTKMLRQAKFEEKVCKVVQGIEYAQHCARVTGLQYNTLCFNDHFVVRRGREVPLYEVWMEDRMAMKFSATGFLMFYHGRSAIERAGTIYIQDYDLNQQARITVGVATNKIRVYYEKIQI